MGWFSQQPIQTLINRRRIMNKTAQEMKIDRLEEENENLKRTIELWREENKKLISQIRRAKKQIKSALQVLSF